MNEGASACAAGIQDACNRLILPDFVIAVAVILAVIIAALMIARKRLPKTWFRMLLILWLALTIGFSIATVVQSETAGDQIRDGMERCRQLARSDNPQASSCEY